jgi:hypothetical protein
MCRTPLYRAATQCGALCGQVPAPSLAGPAGLAHLPRDHLPGALSGEGRAQPGADPTTADPTTAHRPAAPQTAPTGEPAADPVPRAQAADRPN